MTPKEKADELFNKFYNTNTDANSVMIRTKIAIESAIICVDEIIKSNYGSEDFFIEVKKILSN